MQSRIRLGAGLVVMVVVALVLTGCQAAVKGALEGASGVKVDQTGEQVTVTGPDGTVATVGGKTVPEGMPSDFPVYAGTILTSSKSTTAEGTGFSFSMETPDAVKTVADWYKAELEKAGYSVENTFIGGGSGSETAMLVAKKGTSEANITAGAESGKTTIMSVLNVPK
jgi:hypothetical protein